MNAIKIPSLILQPFIENALWHGLSAKKQNKELELDIAKTANNDLIITITDNGIGRKKAAEIKDNKLHKRNSIGIKLTEERLQNFVKDNNYSYALHIDDLFDIDGQANGTKVTLIIKN